MKAVRYSREALKSLRRMPANVARLIVSKVDQYAANPASLANNVTKLQGRDGHRLRVGDWRVIFNEAGDVIDVVEIGPRGGIYD